MCTIQVQLPDKQHYQFLTLSSHLAVCVQASKSYKEAGAKPVTAKMLLLTDEIKPQTEI